MPGLKKEFEDRNVFSTLEIAVYMMDILPPNGATNHKRENLRGLLTGYVHDIERGFLPMDYSFRQYA